ITHYLQKHRSMQLQCSYSVVRLEKELYRPKSHVKSAECNVSNDKSPLFFNQFEELSLCERGCDPTVLEQDTIDGHGKQDMHLRWITSRLFRDRLKETISMIRVASTGVIRQRGGIGR
ncbi:unnamed protein product, partial [Heterotrigona itama]